MPPINYLTSKSAILPVSNITISLLKAARETVAPDRWRKASRSAPLATTKQLVAVAAILPQAGERDSDYEFALKQDQPLVVDRKGWVRWEANSLWHPLPYRFLWVSAKDGRSDEWVLLEGCTQTPGNIRLRSLEAAVALVRQCEARLMDVVIPRSTTPAQEVKLNAS